MVAKVYTRCTQRLCSPAQTLERVLPLTAAMGITRVADVTGLDVIGVPVVMVCRPNARSVSVAQGKGLDMDAARASGVMEAIEQWHAEHIVRPLLFAGAEQLLAAGHELVELDGLPRLSLHAFDMRRKLSWIEARELRSDQPLWLPFELVHTDYTLPLPPGSGCFLTSSNGLASGNHRLEAILHGLYEVIERDAVALWIAAGPSRRTDTRVDLGSVDDPRCRELLNRFERAGIAVAIHDVTSDIGVPVFVADLVDCDAHPSRRLYVGAGRGCHASPAIALIRALTEAAQGRLTLIAGARDDIHRSTYAHARDGARVAAVQAEIEGHTGPWRSFRDHREPSTTTFEQDLEAVLAALDRVGLRQVAWVDLSRPEFGIDVVRVVVPGLESMHEAPGYTPGPRARARMRA